MRLVFINRITIFFMLVLCSALTQANSLNDALIADKNNNNKEAIEIWTKLANSGSTIAMYNLAGHYLSGKGVEQNKALSDQWMKNAIHSGLVEAYLTFNSHAVSPAEGVHISFKSGPLYWLAKQEPDQYTIQLASSRSKKLIEEKFRENELKGKGGYFQYEKSGKEYYALVFGSYETVSAAKLAIANLPESLRKSPPWVRKISSLHKISKLP